MQTVTLCYIYKELLIIAFVHSIKYKMVLPRYYNKRLKHAIPVIVFLVILLFWLNDYFSAESQELLEYQGLSNNKHSKYNPRPPVYDIYTYLNSFISEDISPRPDLGTEEGVNFHWDDWADLYAGEEILGKYREELPEGQCDTTLEEFASVNGYFMETYTKKVLRSMVDMYCKKEIPDRIIVPTDDRYIEVPVIGKKRLGQDGHSTSPQKLEVLYQMKKLQEIGQFPAFKSKQIKKLKNYVNAKAEDFIFNADLEIFKLKEKLRNQDINDEEVKYLKFLEYSNALVERSDTYFKYPWIISDLFNGKSHHIAYPYFRRYIGDRERQSVIQHMIRSWFQFAEANDLVSWINYGSLLGWAHNGANMPWDTDVDVQMPIVHLDRMAREFNKSLILENPIYGNGKYYLEISPTYTKQGNSKNFIDARFIEINTGLYIDISALSHSDVDPPTSLFKGLQKEEISKTLPVNCKHWNWHSLEELFPLKHSFFEGGSVYIPNNVTRLLSRKYGPDSFTTSTHFKGYNYQKDIHLWVSDSICKASPFDDRFTNPDNTTLTYEGACESTFLQDQYKINYCSTQRHLKLHSDLDSLVNHNLEDLPFSRKDSWDYYHDLNAKKATSDAWFINDEAV